MTKSIKRILNVTEANPSPTTTRLLASIVSSESGDLQSAINSLQFVALRPQKINSNKVPDSHSQCIDVEKRAQKRKRRTLIAESDSEPEAESKQRKPQLHEPENAISAFQNVQFGDAADSRRTIDFAVLCKDAGSNRSLFSALGEILYNKRTTNTVCNVRQERLLPDHLSEWERAQPPALTPTELLSIVPVSLDVFLLMLHANLPRFVHTIAGLAMAFDEFAAADSRLSRQRISLDGENEPHVAYVCVQAAYLAHDIADTTFPGFDEFDFIPAASSHCPGGYTAPHAHMQAMQGTMHYDAQRRARARRSHLRRHGVDPLEAVFAPLHASKNERSPPDATLWFQAYLPRNGTFKQHGNESLPPFPRHRAILQSDSEASDVIDDGDSDFAH